MAQRQDGRIGLMVWCGSLLLAVGLLLFASKSSPLFPLNDWVDANALLTLGKGLMQGQVLYRDVFDHKGPFVYLAYGLGWMVSQQGFLGVWVLEVVCFTIFLRCAWHIVALYGGSAWATLCLAPLGAVTLHSASFTHGGSAEELILPLMAASLLGLARVHRHGVLAAGTARLFLLSGAWAGVAFLGKYSWMGFWLGAAVVVAGLLARQGTWRRCAVALGWAGLGVALAVLPWLLYFGAHGATADFIEAYFTANLGAYAQAGPRMAATVAGHIADGLARNAALAALLLLGVLAPLWVPGRDPGWWPRLVFALPCAGLLLSVYGGGKTYAYYFFVFAVFAPLGMALLGWWLRHRRLAGPAALGAACVLAAAGVGATAAWHPNAGLRQVRAQDMVQFRFAALIRAAPDRSVFNYRTLDMGLHTVLGTTATTRFFFLNNLNHGVFPLILDSQKQYVREAATEFVAMRDFESVTEADLAATGILERYRLVATERQSLDNIPFKYLLFQRKAAAGPP